MLSHSLPPAQTLTRKRGFQHRLAALGETKANHLLQSKVGQTHRLLGGGNAADSPFPAATGLGFTGFFLPLFQPMLGMGGNPLPSMNRQPCGPW
jgi:hypothetical protein